MGDTESSSPLGSFGSARAISILNDSEAGDADDAPLVEAVEAAAVGAAEVEASAAGSSLDLAGGRPGPPVDK